MTIFNIRNYFTVSVIRYSVAQLVLLLPGRILSAAVYKKKQPQDKNIYGTSNTECIIIIIILISFPAYGPNVAITLHY